MIQAIRSAFTGASLSQRDFPYFAYERPLAIAHRGGMACWPENTVYAFQQADALGVDALEMDVHRTRDGYLVVSHDPMVDRCTNGKGAIEQLTLEEVQSFDAGHHFSPDGGKSFPYRGKGIRIPTMREVFERFGHLRYIIDAKPPRPEVALQLAALARECEVTDKVCLASFHRPNVAAIRSAHPDIATSGSEPEVQVFWAAQFLRLEGLYKNDALALQVPPVQYGVPFLTQHFIRAAHASNMHVHVWTINEPEEMRRLLDLGADGILTDFPARLLEVMGRGPGSPKPA
ncbi:MAG: glycerophosphodiester phosphodiesterase [Candidatus Hydrogenedens sp.]|nr:glycerophosphodiester phosphodiesterase [Candidatus Hydrogenedens sp.]